MARNQKSTQPATTAQRPSSIVNACRDIMAFREHNTDFAGSQSADRAGFQLSASGAKKRIPII